MPIVRHLLGAAEAKPVVSVCIVSYNTLQLLVRCLESVSRESDGLECEVILVDNASTDDSAAQVARRFPDVQLVGNPTNQGYTRAMNQALRRARGDYVLLLNPDAQLLHGALAALIGALEQHPDWGAVGARLENPDGTLQVTGSRFPSQLYLLLEALGLNARFPRNPVRTHHTYAKWKRNSERIVEALSGACLLVRRSVVAAVGLLDERFMMYKEELDWCKRMHAQGWRVGYVPAARALHYGQQSARQLQEAERAQLYWSSQVRYADKYYGIWMAWMMRMVLHLRGIKVGSTDSLETGMASSAQGM